MIGSSLSEKVRLPGWSIPLDQINDSGNPPVYPKRALEGFTCLHYSVARNPGRSRAAGRFRSPCCQYHQAWIQAVIALRACDCIPSSFPVSGALR